MDILQALFAKMGQSTACLCWVQSSYDWRIDRCQSWVHLWDGLLLHPQERQKTSVFPSM